MKEIKHIKFDEEKFEIKLIHKFNDDWKSGDENSMSFIKLYSGSQPDQRFRDISFLEKKHQKSLQQICSDFGDGIFNLDLIIELIEKVNSK